MSETRVFLQEHDTDIRAVSITIMDRQGPHAAASVFFLGSLLERTHAYVRS